MRVDEEEKKRLTEKYENFTFHGTTRKFRFFTMKIQERVYTEFLGCNENEAGDYFTNLCIIFEAICKTYSLPVKYQNLSILTDDEIDRGYHVTCESENNVRSSHIFIPINDFKNHHWPYVFLHELGHSWLNCPEPTSDKELKELELENDLIAISVYSRIVPPHEAEYKNLVKNRTYIGKSYGEEYFGKELQEAILAQPEAYIEQVIKFRKD